MRLIHLLLVMRNMREQDSLESAAIVEEKDPEKWAARYFLAPGMNWAVLNAKHEPVACVGFNEVAQGVAVAWFVATDAFRTHMKSITRIFRVTVANKIYRRIEAYVNPENVKANEYVRWLGFQFEGVCARRALDGTDRNLWAFVER